MTATATGLSPGVYEDFQYARKGCTVFKAAGTPVQIWEAYCLALASRPLLAREVRRFFEQRKSTPATDLHPELLSTLRILRDKLGATVKKVRKFLPLTKGTPEEYESQELALALLLTSAKGRESAARWLADPVKYEREAAAELKILVGQVEITLASPPAEPAVPTLESAVREEAAGPASPPTLSPASLTASPRNGRVLLTWAAVPAAAGYVVKRSTTRGGPYATVAADVVTTVYPDGTVSNGTTYEYVVCAVTRGGEGPPSPAATATPLGPPPAPASLEARPGNRRVTLAWAAVPEATSYVLKRASSAEGPYSTVAGPANPSYADTNVTNGTTYYYAVAAYNFAGESAASPHARVTPVDPSAPPAGVTATPGNGAVTVEWNPSPEASSYHLKRATDPAGPFETIASPGAPPYVDARVVNGTTYYYVVTAVNAAGESDAPRPAAARPMHPPGPASNLAASAGNGVVTLRWAAAEGAERYAVKRSGVAGGPYAPVGSPAETRFVDAGLTNGTSYYYVVAGVSAGGEGAPTAEAEATPLGPPPAPIGLNAFPGNGRVSLIWPAARGAEHYTVRRSTQKSGPFEPVGQPGGTTYVDTAVTNGTAYSYVVTAGGAGGESAHSPLAQVTPVDPSTAPSGLTATAGNARVSLLWLASREASHYNVKRSTARGGPSTTVASPTGTSFVDTQVTNGTTYYYVVSAVNPAGESANSPQVTATPEVPPPAPAGLTATPGNTRITLAWGGVAEAAGYRLKRATSPGGPYVTVAKDVAAPAYTDGAVTNGTTYYYVVAAVNAGGESPASPEAKAAPIGVPDTPSGLMATPGNGRVFLSWTPSPDATHYTLKRSTSPGGPYTPIANPGAPAYVDTDVANGATYGYVVSAVNAGGESSPSGEAQAAPVAPPPAPATLSATAGNGRVSLSWAACPDAASYNVKRSPLQSGRFSIIATLGPVTGYTDAGVANGTSYEYVVSAVNAGGEGPHSPIAAATPIAPPPAPEQLVATPANGKVSLLWSVSAGATIYNVKRSTARGGPYALVAMVAESTGYQDVSVTNGTTYEYIVSAANVVGEGPACPPASATPVDAPAAPHGLHATPGNGRVNVSWNASPGAARYNVKRSASASGPFETVATPSTTSFTDTGVDNGRPYYYVVSAINPGGESPVSSPAEVTPVGPPPAPQGLTASAANRAVALSWSPVAGASHYNVKRATSPAGPFAAVAAGLAGPSYRDAGLANGTKYFYVVSAVNEGGEGPHTAAVPATPLGPPAAPADVAATPRQGSVDLSWAAMLEATHYVVKRALAREDEFAVIGRPPSNSFTDATVTNGTTYAYVVSAVNAGGEGPGCAPVQARPVDPPVAPAGVTATVGNARVALGWPPSGDATHYHVKRGTSPGGPFAAVASNLAAPAYTDTTVANGTTYFYVVSALNAGGESPDSPPVATSPVAPPPAPTGLTASPGNGWVAVAWNPSAGATGYNVRRATMRGGPYTLVATNLSAPKYTDTTVLNGTTYYYVITALNAGGESALSSGSSKRLVAPPAPPPRLTATPGNATVTLTWSPSPGASRYHVKRAAGPGAPYAVIASPAWTTYTDLTVVNGKTYDYVVTAANEGGESGPSSLAQASPVAPPDLPTGLTAAPGNGTVALAWTGARGAVTYNVKRSTFPGGPYDTVATIVAGTKYADARVANGTTYHYVVSALNVGGESANSHPAKATPVEAPGVPSHLEASAGNGRVLLTWVASRGAVTYNVKRSTAAVGSFATIATTGEITYTDVSVTNGTTYSYVVAAVNAGGESAESDAVQASPVEPPPAPSGVVAMPGNGKVSLQWNACPGATGYAVKRSTGPGGPFTTLASPTTTFFVDTAVQNGSTYYYLVGAANTGGKSPSSARVSATPGPEPSAERTLDRGTSVRVAPPPPKPDTSVRRDTPSGIWTTGVDAQKLIDLRQAVKVQGILTGSTAVELWEVFALISTEGSAVRIVIEQLLRVRVKGETGVFGQTAKTFTEKIQVVRAKWGMVVEKLRPFIREALPERFDPETLEIALGLLLSDPKARGKAETWVTDFPRHKAQATAHMELLRGVALNYRTALGP